MKRHPCMRLTVFTCSSGGVALRVTGPCVVHLVLLLEPSVKRAVARVMSRFSLFLTSSVRVSLSLLISFLTLMLLTRHLLPIRQAVHHLPPPSGVKPHPPHSAVVGLPSPLAVPPLFPWRRPPSDGSPDEPFFLHDPSMCQKNNTARIKTHVP